MGGELRSPRVALLIVLALLVSMSPSGPARPPAAAAQGSGELYPLVPGSPGYPPDLDPRGAAASDPALQGSAPDPLPAGAMDLLRQAGGPAASSPPPKTRLELQQDSRGCFVSVGPGLDGFNGDLNDFSGDGFVDELRQTSGSREWWWVYNREVYADTTTYTSAPNAIRMDDEPTGQADSDMFSTTMVFLPSDTDVSIDFQLYLTTLDPGYDFLYYGFATFKDEGGQTVIDELLYSTLVPNLEPGRWHTVSERITDPALVARLKQAYQAGTVWLVLFNVTDGVFPYVSAIIDDINAVTCNSSASIGGQVSGGPGDGQPNGADMLLVYSSSAEYKVVAATETANGSYSFDQLRALYGDGSDSYQTYFVNDGQSPGRLSLWAGPSTSSLAVGQSLSLPAFDIRDVPLQSPANGAVTTLPATFSWGSRAAGDQYRFCIYDQESFAGGCSGLQAGTSFQLTQAALENLTGLGFEYGRRYAWYVVVESAGGSGWSFYERAIGFSASPPPPPPDAPDPSGQAPSGSGTKDWTVMVYIAGDNNLGDLARYPNAAANLQGQFATLQQLAPSVPNVNIVVLADFYDSSGTRLCHMQPSGQAACQQLGEQNTADPAVLSNFINTAMDRFPATRQMLVISDHGHSVGGVALDETTGPDAVMDPAEIRQALQNSRLASNRAEVIFFAACLMGSVETAAIVSGFADYLVASPDLLWVLSPYERVMPLLSDPATSASPRAVAAGIVDAYRRSVQAASPGLFVSSAAYDMARFAAVRSAVSSLGGALSDGLVASPEAVRGTVDRARGQVQVHDSSGNARLDVREDAFVDLRHLATLLSQLPTEPPIPGVAEIRTAAGGVISALGPVGGANSFVIASAQIGTSAYNLGNASGLQIFFPNGSADAFSRGGQRGMTNAYLNGGLFSGFYHGGTLWDEWVSAYTGVGTSGSVTSGPGRFVAGVQPIAGALPLETTYLPMTRR